MVVRDTVVNGERRWLSFTETLVGVAKLDENGKWFGTTKLVPYTHYDGPIPKEIVVVSEKKKRKFETVLHFNKETFEYDILVSKTEITKENEC